MILASSAWSPNSSLQDFELSYQISVYSCQHMPFRPNVYQVCGISYIIAEWGHMAYNVQVVITCYSIIYYFIKQAPLMDVKINSHGQSNLKGKGSTVASLSLCSFLSFLIILSSLDIFRMIRFQFICSIIINFVIMPFKCTWSQK